MYSQLNLLHGTTKWKNKEEELKTKMYYFF